MARIVLVGAGSVEFTRNLLGDFLAYPELRDATIVLHDIDPDRLHTAERMAAWTAGVLGATPRIEAHLDRGTALRGADFVVDTIQVGGARATQVDFDIPGRYGLRYTINDTINVGGVMRGLRSIPAAGAGRNAGRRSASRGSPATCTMRSGRASSSLAGRRTNGGSKALAVQPASPTTVWPRVSESGKWPPC